LAKRRGKFLSRLAIVARLLALLFVLRVLAGIVYEYQWYFPPDFQASGFLAGREAFFEGSTGSRGCAKGRVHEQFAAAGFSDTQL
jgi:hypothetical protein